MGDVAGTVQEGSVVLGSSLPQCFLGTPKLHKEGKVTGIPLIFLKRGASQNFISYQINSIWYILC